MQLSKTAMAIIELMAHNPQISTVAIGESIGISKRAVLKQISELKLRGIIERVGANKGGSWKINNPANL